MSRPFALLGLLWMLGAAGGVAETSSPGDVPARFRQDDRDGDGRVTREEFSGPEALFKRLDRNGNGAVEAAEVRRGRGGAGRARARPFQAPDDVEFRADVTYGQGGDTALKLDVLIPKTPSDTPRPLLVFVHGGAFRAGDKRSALGRLVGFARDGYVCASINYRLSQEAPFPAQIEDCKCAIRYFRAHAADYGIDVDRIGVWGSSAGGHLVAMLGTAGDVTDLEGAGGWPDQSSRVQAVCDWYGPSNLLSMTEQESRMDHNGANSPEAQLIGGVVRDHPREARRASPITYVSADDPPFLIMHGTKDPTVPFGQSKEFAEALRAAEVRVEFVPLEGAGHGGREFGSPAIRRQVATFFSRLLKPPRP